MVSKDPCLAIDSTAACAWGRGRPSRSRRQGEAFAGGKGEPEDDEMRRADASSRCAGIVGLIA